MARGLMPSEGSSDFSAELLPLHASRLPAALVVIGASEAGLWAAWQACQLLPPHYQVVLLDTQPEPFGLKADAARWALLEEAEADGRLLLYLGCEAQALSPKTKTLTFLNTASHQSQELAYESLILATGTKPFVPPLKGINRLGHYFPASAADAGPLQSWLKRVPVKRVTVIGGGPLGVQMACHYQGLGYQVTLIEQATCLMPKHLSTSNAFWLKEHLKALGITVLVGQAVEGFKGAAPSDAQASLVALEAEESAYDPLTLPLEETVAADLVLLCTGFLPNSQLGYECGLALGPQGGIAVDEELRTQDPAIFAIGGVCEAHNPLTGQPQFQPAWPLQAMPPVAHQAQTQALMPELIQGRVAAANALGIRLGQAGSLRTYQLALSPTLTMGWCGLQPHQLTALAKPYQALTQPVNAQGAWLTLFVEAAEPHRLLGAQLVYPPALAESLLATLVTAISTRLGLKNLLCLALPASLLHALGPWLLETLLELETRAHSKTGVSLASLVSHR